MAAQDCSSDSTISKAQRRYKVGYISTRHISNRTFMTTYYSQHPSLHLKGNWLAEAGFGTDTPVNVRVLQGCLIITVQEPEQEPEVMQTLHKVCKLSARKQRQITEFIQVVAAPQKLVGKKG